MTDHDRIQAALPGYRVGDLVGRGGCGEVLTGTHNRLQRPVAIKQIPAQFAKDPAVRRRFAAEARLMASIDHPHVVPVYDYIECDDLCLLVMEYLPAGTVASRFAEDGFDAPSAMAVALACAAGLESAHRRGVLHRDVKPANLLFAENGTIKLTDFGIAKIVGGNETLVTRAGEIVGTPSYIAPEQARGQQVSPATDVYALATMLYQLLSGVLPFPPGEDSMATLFKHAFEQPRSLSEVAPSVPEPLVEVVMTGLSTDPGERYASAESFGVALAQHAAGCWGGDWLSSAGVSVIGADTITSAATGANVKSGNEPSHDTTATIAIRSRPPVAASSTAVRPANTRQERGLRFADVEPADLTPIQHVVRFRSPRGPYTLAAVLALAAIVLAFLGIGAPEPHDGVPPGSVTVAGMDPGTSDVVNVDMTKPIPVTVHADRGETASLALSVLDRAIGRHDAALTADEHGSFALLPPPLNPYLVAGRVTAELTVWHDGNAVATHRFTVQSKQSPYPTALTVLAVIVALFGLANVESYLRALRSGANRVGSTVGLTVSAMALAVTFVAAAWILMGHQPALATLVACCTAAAGAAIAAAVGAPRAGELNRYRRAKRAQQRRAALRVV
jgi:serine/threonine protein kinase